MLKVIKVYINLIVNKNVMRYLLPQYLKYYTLGCFIIFYNSINVIKKLGLGQLVKTKKVN